MKGNEKNRKGEPNMNNETMPELEDINAAINNMMGKLDLYVERGIRALEVFLEIKAEEN